MKVNMTFAVEWTTSGNEKEPEKVQASAWLGYEP